MSIRVKLYDCPMSQLLRTGPKRLNRAAKNLLIGSKFRRVFVLASRRLLLFCCCCSALLCSQTTRGCCCDLATGSSSVLAADRNIWSAFRLIKIIPYFPGNQKQEQLQASWADRSLASRMSIEIRSISLKFIVPRAFVLSAAIILSNGGLDDGNSVWSQFGN